MEIRYQTEHALLSQEYDCQWKPLGNTHTNSCMWYLFVVNAQDSTIDLSHPVFWNRLREILEETDDLMTVHYKYHNKFPKLVMFMVNKPLLSEVLAAMNKVQDECTKAKMGLELAECVE